MARHRALRRLRAEARTAMLAATSPEALASRSSGVARGQEHFAHLRIGLGRPVAGEVEEDDHHPRPGEHRSAVAELRLDGHRPGADLGDRGPAVVRLGAEQHRTQVVDVGLRDDHAEPALVYLSSRDHRDARLLEVLEVLDVVDVPVDVDVGEPDVDRVVAGLLGQRRRTAPGLLVGLEVALERGPLLGGDPPGPLVGEDVRREHGRRAQVDDPVAPSVVRLSWKTS